MLAMKVSSLSHTALLLALTQCLLHTYTNNTQYRVDTVQQHNTGKQMRVWSAYLQGVWTLSQIHVFSEYQLFGK